MNRCWAASRCRPTATFTARPSSAATSLPGAHLRGRHLRLPGGGPNGPTLEILTYDQLAPGLPTAPNRPGFGHIAFIVDDIAAGRQAVLAAGGGEVGETVTLALADGAKVTMCLSDRPGGEYRGAAAVVNALYNLEDLATRP